MALFFVLLLTGSGAVHAASNIDLCNPPAGVTVKDSICSPEDAAGVVFNVAVAIKVLRQKCPGLAGNNKTGWDVSVRLWTRRNRRWLDAAAKVKTQKKNAVFNWDLPVPAPYELQQKPTAAECRDDEAAIDKGQWDIDMDPRLRVVESFLR